LLNSHDNYNVSVCFIESKSKTGDQTLNPFNFKRAWEKPATPVEEPDSNISLRERLLEEKLNAMQEKLDRFQSFLDLDSEMLNQIEEFQANRKGTGRGKRSQPSTSFFGRLRSSFAAGTLNNLHV